LRLVKLVVEDGLTFERAAARSNVAKSTCWGWVDRWRAASDQERASLACLEDRSSRPRCSPRLLDEDIQEHICEVRRATGWGPRLVAGCVGRHHSTVWKVLHRHDLSRLPRPDRGEPNRYEWPCPGDLLHIDVSHYARFKRPGHRVTGDRSSTAAEKQAALGYECGHACVDDHTRLAFAQIRDDERSPSVTAFVADCLAFYRSHGIKVKRILTDNAWSYIHNRSLSELLAAENIEHWTIRPRRPQTNGKVERFHQTMEREWGSGLTYRSSEHRRHALQHWINYYNEHRPHSSIGGHPPISRVRNLREQDS
jgi:transposase InsO family protein/transposase-like protein